MIGLFHRIVRESFLGEKRNVGRLVAGCWLGADRRLSTKERKVYFSKRVHVDIGEIERNSRISLVVSFSYGSRKSWCNPGGSLCMTGCRTE